MLGWDLLALGLPASDAPFAAGRFEQRIEWPGVWLERGRIDAGDTRLRTSALGLAGYDALGCAWFASGSAWTDAERERLLDAARAVPGDGLVAGATAPDPRLVVVRVLGPRVEPVMALLAAVRAAWRHEAWSLDAAPPRVWRT
jgi:urease accessory protein